MNHKHSLWRLGLSPAVWGIHFLLCYIIVALWCAKYPWIELKNIRMIIFIITFIALGIAGWGVLSGIRKHKDGEGGLPHDDDSLSDRERFLGFTRFLVSILSEVAIIYTAYAIFLFRSCE